MIVLDLVFSVLYAFSAYPTTAKSLKLLWVLFDLKVVPPFASRMFKCGWITPTSDTVVLTYPATAPIHVEDVFVCTLELFM